MREAGIFLRWPAAALHQGLKVCCSPHRPGRSGSTAAKYGLSHLILLEKHESFRHCPKHRKPLPCAHCALTATAPVITPLVGMPRDEPGDVPVPVPRKSGRPALGDRPMTPAERKTRERTMKAAKKSDEVKRNIVAALMRKIRSAQPKITSKAFQAAAARTRNRKRLRKLHDDFLEMSMAALNEVLETYKLTPDSHGRLHNERSGEASRKYGMNEMERILAAQSTRTGAVKPEGHGKDEDEPSEDDNGDTGDFRPPSGPRIPPEHIAFLRNRDAIIRELINEYVKKISDDESCTLHRCLLCNRVLQELPDAMQHFWVEYGKGVEAYHKHLDAIDLGKDSQDEATDRYHADRVMQARKAYIHNKHAMKVWEKAKTRTVKVRVRRRVS